MPIIKLLQHGFDTLTGEIGGIEFKDGVSVENISRRDADRIGASMMVEDVDSGEQYNAASTIEKKLRADRHSDMVSRENENAVEPAEPAPESAPGPEVVEEPEPEEVDEVGAELERVEEAEAKVYTEAELAQIADEDGIAGLREIAAPLGVSDKSIRGLIPKILQAQKSK